MSFEKLNPTSGGTATRAHRAGERFTMFYHVYMGIIPLLIS